MEERNLRMVCQGRGARLSPKDRLLYGLLINNTKYICNITEAED
jgi:hypothetical protein